MDNNKSGAPEKPSKGVLMKVVLGLALIGAGGGGAFGLLAAGIINPKQEETARGPQLVPKGGVDPYAFTPANGELSDVVHGQGGSRYRTAYFTFSDTFTSNLRDTNVLAQVSLAASTQHDGRVLMWLKEHEPAIHSRVLVELADTGADSIDTPAGKKALQQRLTAAINAVLEEKEGFGGVDTVHFRSFIVQ